MRHFPVSPDQRLDACGQTSTEYLVVLGGVFAALAGIRIYFEAQSRDYLRSLMTFLRLPF